MQANLSKTRSGNRKRRDRSPISKKTSRMHRSHRHSSAQRTEPSSLTEPSSSNFSPHIVGDAGGPSALPQYHAPENVTSQDFSFHPSFQCNQGVQFQTPSEIVNPQPIPSGSRVMHQPTDIRLCDVSPSSPGPPMLPPASYYAQLQSMSLANPAQNARGGFMHPSLSLDSFPLHPSASFRTLAEPEYWQADSSQEHALQPRGDSAGADFSHYTFPTRQVHEFADQPSDYWGNQQFGHPVQIVEQVPNPTLCDCVDLGIGQYCTHSGSPGRGSLCALYAIIFCPDAIHLRYLDKIVAAQLSRSLLW
jgi:hypothetical protein